eukprot:2624184-Pyramimonas_sp.AAC.1
MPSAFARSPSVKPSIAVGKCGIRRVEHAVSLNRWASSNCQATGLRGGRSIRSAPPRAFSASAIVGVAFHAWQ